MTTLDFAADTYSSGVATIHPGLALIQLHDALWRVTRPSGEVLGYVEQIVESDGLRYRAKRLVIRQRRFVSIGEFWRMEDAVDCFRFG
jgi:hypothetical protein